MGTLGVQDGDSGGSRWGLWGFKMGTLGVQDGDSGVQDGDSGGSRWGLWGFNMGTLGVSEIQSQVFTLIKTHYHIWAVVYTRGLHKQPGVQAMNLHLHLAPSGANSLNQTTCVNYNTHACTHIFNTQCHM